MRNHRSRLGDRGVVRFEVLGRDGDRGLMRSLARRLADDTPDALDLRATVSLSIAGGFSRKGGILAALRRSPLVGADIALSRPREEGRAVGPSCASCSTPTSSAACSSRRCARRSWPGWRISPTGTSSSLPQTVAELRRGVLESLREKADGISEPVRGRWHPCHGRGLVRAVAA